MSEKHKYQQVIPEIPRTAVDIYRMLPEGTRCEVIFNELIMSPAPTPQHQLLFSDLHALLYMFLQSAGIGKVVPSPIDVYLDGMDSVIQPDMLVLLNENLDKIKTDGIYGTPDVAIEILSSNRTYDTKRKRVLYEKAGVKEYFMIDPQNKITTLLILDGAGVYQQAYEAPGVLRSALLSCDIAF